MFTYFPGADDAAVGPAPCVGNDEVLVADAPQSAVSGFAIILSLILRFNHGILEDQRSEAKVDAMILDVALPLALLPFEAIHGSF
jgi:hypothetical protein